MITGPFAQQLEANRVRFNTKFAEARRQRPRLDPAAFGEVLTTTVTPVVDAVSRVRPERVPAAAEALFDLALALLGQELLGPASRHPHVAAAWSALFPALARFIAEAPHTVAGSLTNAIYNLSTTPGARPHEWSALMLALAEVCPDSAQLLQAGQVAAWRAGMAHYRSGALELCRTLPPVIVRAALGLPADPRPVADLIESLAADPWLHPTSIPNQQSTIKNLKVVSRVGAFRGFGGLFMQPPMVACAGEHFLVSDGDDAWLLVADAFGATFHRTSGLPTSNSRSPFTLNKDGTVKANGQKAAFPELVEPTSQAGNSTTLAVTTALSHAVFLVALTQGD